MYPYSCPANEYRTKIAEMRDAIKMRANELMRLMGLRPQDRIQIGSGVVVDRFTTPEDVQ